MAEETIPLSRLGPPSTQESTVFPAVRSLMWWWFSALTMSSNYYLRYEPLEIEHMFSVLLCDRFIYLFIFYLVTELNFTRALS